MMPVQGLCTASASKHLSPFGFDICFFREFAFLIVWSCALYGWSDLAMFMPSMYWVMQFWDLTRVSLFEHEMRKMEPEVM
jgi:hypothetical protein